MKTEIELGKTYNGKGRDDGTGLKFLRAWASPVPSLLTCVTIISICLFQADSKLRSIR